MICDHVGTVRGNGIRKEVRGEYDLLPRLDSVDEGLNNPLLGLCSRKSGYRRRAWRIGLVCKGRSIFGGRG